MPELPGMVVLYMLHIVPLGGELLLVQSIQVNGSSRRWLRQNCMHMEAYASSFECKPPLASQKALHQTDTMHRLALFHQIPTNNYWKRHVLSATLRLHICSMKPTMSCGFVTSRGANDIILSECCKVCLTSLAVMSSQQS